MKQRIWKLTALLLAVCLLLPLAACGNTEDDGIPDSTAYTAQQRFDALLNHVQFDAELSDRSKSAATTYAGMPEGATITMYSTNARFADELTWIQLANESDKASVKEIVESHISQREDHFRSYQQDQLPKLENYVLWEDSLNIILCITSDAENAKTIVNDPSKASSTPTAPSQTPTDPVNTDPAPTEPTPTEPTPTEPPKEQKPLNAQGYPAITSIDQSRRDLGNAFLIDNMAYEYYNYSAGAAKNYANVVSRLAKNLNGEANVYCLVIPTAVGIVFPDNLMEKYGDYIEDQGARMEQIYGMMDSSVIPVNCYENLMQHRDEYLYYRSDWHWTGLGAYYAYETFCKVKGITPYTLDERPLSVFEGYVGGLYWWCGEEPILRETPDTVYAWHPHSENAYMYFTDSYGNRMGWNIISDVSGRGSSEKYLTFAAGDQPFAEFYNPDVTDGSVAIVIKESFGNVLMSYLIDHYSTVYEIDYRYWEGDLAAFARQVGADDIIFANNTGAIRSDVRVGEMDYIVP